jgi:L-threonylcarbamoyladenylate synthase
MEVSVDNIDKAAAVLQRNGLVAFPTETVYGLGANAMSNEAVECIFRAKGRPSDNPLIVHVDSLESAEKLVSFDSVSIQLANSFWPGPLTLVLPVTAGVVASRVTAGLCTVGVRIPNHPTALALLKACKLPLAAPSCNKSGSPSPTTAAHVVSDFKNSESGGPEIVLDGGACTVGLESTVVQVDTVSGDIHILRPGGVSAEMIAEKLGMSAEKIKHSYSVKDAEVPRAPGMRYRHYSPKATVFATSEWKTVESELTQDDLVLAFDSTEIGSDKPIRWSMGSTPKDVETASNRLFDFFRKADDIKAPRVFVDCSFNINSGLGAALWNRISKAASTKH